MQAEVAVAGIGPGTVRKIRTLYEFIVFRLRILISGHHHPLCDLAHLVAHLSELAPTPEPQANPAIA